MQLNNFQGMQSIISLCSNLHATITYIPFIICYSNSSAVLLKSVAFPTLN